MVKEIRNIIKAYDAAVLSGKKCALSAVVQIVGSSYRRPGARMLVTDQGELTGAISGGCLEGDALRKAMLVLSQQQSKLVTYDTSDEEDAIIGVQLGCAGIIQVLFEHIHPSHPYNPIQLLRKAIAIRQNCVLVTLFSLENKRHKQPGTCLLMEANGHFSGSIPYPELDMIIRKDVYKVMETGQSAFKNYDTKDDKVNAFIEFLEPPVSLVVVGAGNDALPLTQIAQILGWEVRVVDGRISHANPERFNTACQIVVSKPEQVLDQIPLDNRTVFVVMTHNYNYDLAMLKALIARPLKYIGMLGPRKKMERMIQEIQDEGVKITNEMLTKVYGPVGLEIGAETAEEIALSILSEIQAVLQGKKGGFLRLKKSVIHQRNND